MLLFLLIWTLMGKFWCEQLHMHILQKLRWGLLDPTEFS